MSRFFRTGDDSSSESSSDEEELYSEEEEEEEKDVKESEEEESDEDEDEDEDESDEESSDEEGVKKTGASRFLRGESSESEDSDEDQPKTVKSAKDKRFAELEATIDTIEKKQKISDWGAVSNGRSFLSPSIFLSLCPFIYRPYMKTYIYTHPRTSPANRHGQSSTSSSARPSR